VARLFILIAAISGLIAVVLGAFAAHGLKQMLAPAALYVFQTGVQYQMYHALALLVVGVLMLIKPSLSGLKASGVAYILGTLLFSGSLYALALGAPRWVGPITPLGGLSFMLGWLLLAMAAWHLKP
jgi:uncharacterized membrane protein YgdD (TMEM256/DUF423 family)